MLESNISILYSALAERVTLPFVKSLFESIAKDDDYHSARLKDASDQMAKQKTRQNGKEKLEYLYNITFAVYSDVIAKEEVLEQLDNDELFTLTGKLMLLEKSLRQKYVDAQSKTLKVTKKETLLDQHRVLSNFGSLFERLIDDRDQHQKILGTIQSLLVQEAPGNLEFGALNVCLPEEAVKVNQIARKIKLS
ncbi:MAG TPA: ferritin family protein [Candidatus Nanoarchaeia archaeon]|nr:ferritin family protein [Candidatus Nanoarchaeia archaeon]